MIEFYKGGGEDESKMGFELVLVINDPVTQFPFYSSLNSKKGTFFK